MLLSEVIHWFYRSKKLCVASFLLIDFCGFFEVIKFFETHFIMESTGSQKGQKQRQRQEHQTNFL